MSDLEDPELRFIRNTRKNFEDVNLGRVDKGEGWADTHMNHRMPVSLAEESTGTMPYCTGDWGIRPLAVGPMTESGERFWVTRLIWELNRELKMELGTSISMSRTLSGIRKVVNNVGMLDVTCIGASNAGRTTEALRKKGVKTSMVGKTGWKLSNSSMAAAELTIRQEGRQECPVILHCMDGSVFFAVGKNGAMNIPARGKDGIVHVRGKVAVAKGLQLSLVLEQLEEFLVGRRDLLTILVCPSVRFVVSCCLPHDNLTEEEKVEEGKRMLRELGSLRREVRNWLYKKELKNVVLADQLEASGAASSWDKAKGLMVDNVHMQPVGYAKLAMAIREAVQRWLVGQKRKIQVKIMRIFIH
jgi:lysophospholipase L1-like esterase